MYGQLLIVAALWGADPAVPPAAADTERAAPPENLSLQYAQAKLQLAQANLKRIEQLNRRLKRSVPASVVAEFKSDVGVAELQVRQAAADEQGEFAVWLRRAQSELEAATSRWKRAVEGNRKMQGTFEPLDVERYRLRAEVARLQLARGKSLVDASRAAQLEWQVELLNNEVDRLREEQTRVAPFIRYYPVYWW